MELNDEERVYLEELLRWDLDRQNKEIPTLRGPTLVKAIEDSNHAEAILKKVGPNG